MAGQHYSSTPFGHSSKSLCYSSSWHHSSRSQQSRLPRLLAYSSSCSRCCSTSSHERYSLIRGMTQDVLHLLAWFLVKHIQLCVSVPAFDS